ncbi:hypothetical protein FO519_001712 [Halicephalobus sp. NKZ332]|nr:hypothetical protein FO519_001712 [Halicephalobus sp. NKZ332]
MIKSMVDMFTTIQADRLKPFEVRVNAVLSGPFESGALFSEFKFPLSDEDKVKYDKYCNEIVSRIPLGRFGDFEGIAQVYLQLASNSLVSGAHWLFDGGACATTHQLEESQKVHFWEEIPN